MGALRGGGGLEMRKLREVKTLIKLRKIRLKRDQKGECMQG